MCTYLSLTALFCMIATFTIAHAQLMAKVLSSTRPLAIADGGAEASTSAEPRRADLLFQLLQKNLEKQVMRYIIFLN